MANNITLNAGSGGSTLATEQNGTAEQYQVVKLADGTPGSFTRLAITAAGAMKTDGTSTNQPVQGTAASGAVLAGNPVRAGAAFNTTQPTVTSGQTVDLQATARGGLIVSSGVDTLHVTVDSAPTTSVTGTFWQATQPVSGTVTANAGTNLNTSALALESGGNLATIAGALAAQEATTSGVKGLTAFGAVTTNAPTYVTAKSDALSLDTSGLLRVSLKDTPANTNKLLVTPDLPSGASTAAKQPALGTAGSASADVITVQGIASMTKLLVTPDSVALPANQSVNVNQLAGTATSVNSGVKDAGTLRVVIATDQPALTNKLLVTPDSVALPANQSVNVSQINAVTPLMGNGVTGTGSQRVTIASDNTAFQVKATGNAGTAFDAAAGTAATNSVTVVNVPPTAGNAGWTFKFFGDGTVGTDWNGTKQQIVGAAATFGGYIDIFNPNTATSFLQIFNKTAANVTLGTTVPDIVIPLPGIASASATGSGRNLEISQGVKFSTGLTMAVTTTVGGATAPASKCYGTILYST